MRVAQGVALTLSALTLWVTSAQAEYNVGVGIADITGPAAEVNMMGYAHPGQKTAGIHMRQHSRAFIISSPSGNSSTAGQQGRVVFVSIDACMVDTLVKLEVVSRLRSRYGDLYTAGNLCISGIHTHSGPAGFLQYLLYDITALGFVKESFYALVDGIVKSIERAHDNIKPGANIYINQGQLLDANINRSPSAYLNNPPDERERYKYNVDKDMTLVKITDSNKKDVASINWFPVHCTSMNNTNKLISGDNKGYASYLFEQKMNPGKLPGKGEFVAAFAQGNEGDVSPNTRGPHCLDTGLPCDTNTSTCNGKNELCVASGPGRDMVDSTRIIGEKQFNAAYDLYKNADQLVSGPIKFRHMYVDMTDVDVTLPDNTTGKTCLPAMGYAFAAGTTDGPGAFDFHQGSTSGNLLWNLLRDFLAAPSKAQRDCHHPKPILLDTGEISFPYEWDPRIVSVQLFQIGQLVVCAVPAEFSTMSGRRLRERVRRALQPAGGGGHNLTVVVAGLSNDYSSYVTTYEEYQVQRYEGGSTIYGPHTLEAYIQKFELLAKSMRDNSSVPAGPTPPNLLHKQLSFLPGVIFDHAPLGKHFGSVLQEAHKEYHVNDSVAVKFVAGNPRNNLMTEDTFLTVDYYQPLTKQWSTMYTDANWETTYEWSRQSTILGESEVTVTWRVPSDVIAGQYRISHHGHYKSFGGSVHPYSGMSAVFSVIQPGCTSNCNGTDNHHSNDNHIPWTG